MNPTLALALLSVLFFATAAGIVLKQRAARSCPKHHRSAGLAAQALATACFGVGLVLAALAAVVLLQLGL
ncbi:hypothetical protein [Paludisphaera mucosa]|uniref:Uncharacterized protein n=1 Tax=Paludisphaera mucosa TaxID=3030827 RepID=A0ABT6FL01_9BACT|nr:hypothetical protein [Paludisphaera mucosa]MDG3008256.1 hypothetical protein [Paludisphaera mucosa]